MQPSKRRDAACNLAPRDWSAAAEIAAGISDPWYACQAFAWCGRHAPAQKAWSLIDESFHRAAAGKDWYQRAAGAAWPLRALIERGEHVLAEREFDRTSLIVPDVSPPSSRAEAMFLLFSAAAIGQGELPRKAFRLVLSTCQPILHWRQKRAVRDSAAIIVSIGALPSEAAIAQVDDVDVREAISRKLASGETLRPRTFFWTRD